jgi:hypothetical protein
MNWNKRIVKVIIFFNQLPKFHSISKALKIYELLDLRLSWQFIANGDPASAWWHCLEVGYIASILEMLLKI